MLLCGPLLVHLKATTSTASSTMLHMVAAGRICFLIYMYMLVVLTSVLCLCALNIAQSALHVLRYGH
jgi:hypothetical protein